MLREGANVPDRKSSSRNMAEGAIDKAKSRAIEAAGAATGARSKKSEGRTERSKGEAKKSGAAKDLGK
jgi:uncharacterized protein YjbJ (UPF0337 family)